MRRMYSKNQLENQTEELLGSGVIPSIKADEIIENMNGYSFAYNTSIVGFTLENVYIGAVKNGNKLTFVVALNVTRTQDDLSGTKIVGNFTIPSTIGEKLYPANIAGLNYLDNRVIQAWSSGWAKKDLISYLIKKNNTTVEFDFDSGINTILTKDTKYYVRYETTFLLSEDISQ